MSSKQKVGLATGLVLLAIFGLARMSSTSLDLSTILSPITSSAPLAGDAQSKASKLMGAERGASGVEVESDDDAAPTEREDAIKEMKKQKEIIQDIRVAINETKGKPVQ